MDYEYSSNDKKLIERLEVFMDEFIYPNELHRDQVARLELKNHQ